MKTNPLNLSKITLAKFLSLIILPIILLSCNGQREKLSVISFNLLENGNDTITIFTRDPLDYSPSNIHHIVLDSLGQGTIALDWQDFVFATVDIKERSIHVLVQPQTNLTIAGKLNHLPESLELTGEGAIVNNYLTDISIIYKEFELWENKLFFRLDSINFLKRQETKQTRIKELNSEYFHKRGIPDNLRRLLISQNEAISILEILNYELANQTQMGLPVNSILDHESLLSYHHIFYAAALDQYLSSRIIGPIWKNVKSSDIDSVNYIGPELIDAKIISLDAPMSIKEYLAARNVHLYLTSGITTPPVLGIYDQWFKSFPESSYGQTLIKSLQKIQTLESGIEAPEITGFTITGERWSSKELEGKIVYVDVWATWCGPCMKSLPYLQKLQETFSHSDDVVFLTVSIDKDQEKWKKTLSETALMGIHINSYRTSIKEDFMISGVPRYMLIDQSGSIVLANAPSPDEVDITNEILRVLEHDNTPR